MRFEAKVSAVAWSEAALQKRYRITLTGEERDRLDALLKRGTGAKGTGPKGKLAHARTLLLTDASEVGPGWTDAAVAEAVRVSVRSVER